MFHYLPIQPKANRIWLDTEFYENGKTIELISIGMVREDGKRLYLENGEIDLDTVSPWVKENVVPYLTTGNPEVLLSKSEICSKIVEFAGDQPEFWSWYSSYDWVVLCQLFGSMINLPSNWPMFCLDLKQVVHLMGNPQLPKQTFTLHHALSDAVWIKDAWNWLLNHQKELVGDNPFKNTLIMN